MFPPPPLPAAPRNHAPPSGGAAPLSAHTPPGRAARRHTQARERRPPVGTRWPPASARRIAEWRCGAPLRTTPPSRAARRPGNADLRSARAGLRPAHGATPIGGAAPLSALPHRAEQHAGQGTPTSGRHRCAQRSETTHCRSAKKRGDGLERRPPVGTAAQSAAKPRNAHWRRGAPLRTTPPSRAARRQGNADLWAVLPVGPGTPWPPAGARRKTAPEGSACRTLPPCRGSLAARAYGATGSLREGFSGLLAASASRSSWSSSRTRLARLIVPITTGRAVLYLTLGYGA